MKFLFKHKSEEECGDNDDVIKEKIETDIYRDNNHIYFYIEIDRSSILKLNVLIREAEEYCVITALKLRIDEIPIYIHIYSSGGYLYSAFSAIDTILGTKVPVYSVIEGATASAGTLISIVCKKRFIRRNSHMLIHQLSSECWGKMAEITDEFQNLSELMEKITNMYIKYTNLPAKKLKKLLKRDLWLDAEKSIKYGLVDDYY
jgi:ATP-dependent protease ClpP protease subunit